MVAQTPLTADDCRAPGKSPPVKKNHADRWVGFRYPHVMGMKLWMAMMLLSACGGGPALRNVPQPNKNVMAGGAAAIAGAATLADPNGQAQRVKEANKQDEALKQQKSGGTVPADVLDRLDAKKEKEKAKQAPKQEPKPEPEIEGEP